MCAWMQNIFNSSVFFCLAINMKMVAMINLCKFLSLTYASDGLAKLKKKKKEQQQRKTIVVKLFLNYQRVNGIWKHKRLFLLLSR